MSLSIVSKCKCIVDSSEIDSLKRALTLLINKEKIDKFKELSIKLAIIGLAFTSCEHGSFIKTTYSTGISYEKILKRIELFEKCFGIEIVFKKELRSIFKTISQYLLNSIKDSLFEKTRLLFLAFLEGNVKLIRRISLEILKSI